MVSLGLLLAVSAEALSLAFGHLSNGLNYYRSGRHDMALREFSVVLTEYRDTPAADDALYWTAMTQQARGEDDKASAMLSELARLYPASPYVGVTTAAPAARVAPSPAPMPATATAASPAPEPVKVAAATPAPAPAPTPTGIPPAAVGIRRRGETTSLEMNGVPFKTAGEFEAAIADLKRSRGNLTVLLRQDPGVDLQVVIDVMNICEKLQINIRTQ